MIHEDTRPLPGTTRPASEGTRPDRGRPDHHGRRGLVTGASGYVGGQVVLRLLDEGWTVRVLARDPHRLPDEWRDRVEVAEGDAGDEDAVRAAVAGVDVAWYLIHSMGGSDDFADTDRRMATTFAAACADASVQRIVYLGGLHPEGEELSEHLASRVEVGRILLDSGVPTAAVQAGVVLGDGSASFDMLRALAERLPAAGGPGWLRNRIQPIHVDDVVHYLVRAADLDATHNRTFDVGGPVALPYADMMKRCAAVQGMGPRPVLTAPITTPRLAAHWIGLVTPVDARMARPLIESMLHDTVVKERDLDDLVGAPPGGVLGFDDAVRRAASDTDPWRWAKVLGLTSLAVVATAAVGTAVTTPGSRWYRGLDKPSWQPPGQAFGLVWTPLYADLAAMSALHLTDALDAGDDAEVRSYAGVLALNLVLNAAWSCTFFGLRRPGAATVVSAALTASSADLVRRVGVRRERGVVLAPLAAWTAFATALSASIWRRNR